MANLNIDPSTYVMKSGKYKNMLAVDVVDLQTVNKNGETVDTGLAYIWNFYASKIGSVTPIL